jgi:hypothetical protein
MNAARNATFSLLLALGGACGGEDARFTVNYAPEFAGSSHHTVSLFGVFKDGRMDAEAWEDVAPGISNLFGHSTCSAAFGTDLVTNNPSLASAVDEYTRNYGVTDALLNEFAASAKGDLILVVSIAGKPRSPSTEPVIDTPPPMSRGTGAARGGAPPSDPSGSAMAVSFRPVEVSASLFSVSLHRSVGSIAERYAGKSGDEAIAKLEDQVKDALPVARCEGWDFEAHPVDGARVHALPEP